MFVLHFIHLYSADGAYTAAHTQNSLETAVPVFAKQKSNGHWVCVCRFLTAHQYTKGYSVPCHDTQTHADDDKGKIMALKSENGKTLGKFLASFENDNHYHNALIV